jgi:hypothetical protein
MTAALAGFAGSALLPGAYLCAGYSCAQYQRELPVVVNGVSLFDRILQPVARAGYEISHIQAVTDQMP